MGGKGWSAYYQNELSSQGKKEQKSRGQEIELKSQNLLPIPMGREGKGEGEKFLNFVRILNGISGIRSGVQ